MTKKIFVGLLLSLAVSACEPSPTENNSNVNRNANVPAQASPNTAPSPPAESIAAPMAQLKTGDKVKISVNGAATEATVVSVDEKAGKATVKVQGETKERTVNLSEIVKQ